MKTFTTKEILEKLSSKFSNLVLLEDYKGANEKILIKCTNCGHEWKVTPRSVINSKCGCPKCGLAKNKHERAKSKFISRLDKSKYDLIEYKGFLDVTVACKECGNIRHTTADNILRFGCKVCSSIQANIRAGNTLTTEEFIKRAKEVHGDRYDYSKVEYKNYIIKVPIICSTHGIFMQSPGKHLSGQNCPYCSESRGEEIVRLCLTKENIKFIPQYPILLHTRALADFYIELNDKKFIIEVNGKQHYEAIEYFGGEVAFAKQLKRDKALAEYCLHNNIKLYIIRYDEDVAKRIQEITTEITAV